MMLKKSIKAALPLLPLAIAAAVVLNASRQTAPPLVGLTPTSAVRPWFYVAGNKPYQAGTAFVTTYAHGKGQMLVTALHLLGTAGGLAQDIPPAQLGRQVQRVRGTRFSNDAQLVEADAALTRSGFPFTDTGNARGDVVAFRVVKNSGAAVMKLAARNPKAGEWVWLVGDEYRNHPQALRPYPAQVVGVDANGLELKMASAIAVRGFSGAPIVNAKAEVVGILIGGDHEGNVTAHDVESMKRYLPG